jgi:hypothetical protein
LSKQYDVSGDLPALQQFLRFGCYQDREFLGNDGLTPAFFEQLELGCPVFYEQVNQQSRPAKDDRSFVRHQAKYPPSHQTARSDPTLSIMHQGEEFLREQAVSITSQYGYYGCRRVTYMLRNVGWFVNNNKRVERIWCQEGLKVAAIQSKRADFCSTIDRS